MGKWTKVVKDLKLKEAPQESAYQLKINTEKEAIIQLLTGGGELQAATLRRVNLETRLDAAIADEEEAREVKPEPFDPKDLKSSDFARLMKTAREEEDYYETLASQAGVRVEAIRQLMLPAYEAEGVQKVTLKSGYNFAQEVEPYSSTISEEIICPYCRFTEGEQAGQLKEPEKVNEETGEIIACEFCDGKGKQTGKEIFRRYCMADPDLKQSLSLAWQTQNSLVKQFLLNGEEPPPGIKIFCKSKIVMRKPKGSGSDESE